jgi:hypothetical protein
MPCGVSRSTTFLLPEIQTKPELKNTITRPALGFEPLELIAKLTTLNKLNQK